MSEVRKIDTTLAEMIRTMKLKPSKNSVVVLDTESTVYTGPDGKGGVIFDFAYAPVDILSGSIKKPVGSLVYESIKDVRIIKEIENWEKLRFASKDSVYNFYKLLNSKGWWKEGIISEGDPIQSMFRIANKAAEKRLPILKKEQEGLQKSALYWSMRKTFQNPSSSPSTAKYRERTEDLAAVNLAISSIEDFLKEQDDLEGFLEKGVLASNQTLNSIKKQAYRKMYNEQKFYYSTKDFKNDSVLFQSLSVDYNMKRWATIMQDFKSEMDSLAHNGELLGITAYGLAFAEKRFIRQTAKAYGTPDYEDILDDYANFCLKNFAQLTDQMNVEEVLEALSKYSGTDILYEGMEKALNTQQWTSKLGFDLWYDHLFDKKDYKQSHEAARDVKDESEAFLKALGEKIIPILERM